MLQPIDRETLTGLTRILLIRHADALTAKAGQTDQQRSLKRDGRRKAARLKRILRKRYGDNFDACIGTVQGSGVNRTKETGEILTGVVPLIVYENYPDPDASPENRYYEDALYAKLGNKSVNAYRKLDKRGVVDVIAERMLSANLRRLRDTDETRPARCLSIVGHGTTSQAMGQQICAGNDQIVKRLGNIVLGTAEAIEICLENGQAVRMEHIQNN